MKSNYKNFFAIVLIVILGFVLFRAGESYEVRFNGFIVEIDMPKSSETQTIDIRDYKNQINEPWEDFGDLFNGQFDPSVAYAFVNSETTELFTYVESPALSGTGGPSGSVIKVDLDSLQGTSLGAFFGYIDNINNIVHAPNDDYYIIIGHSNSGVGCRSVLLEVQSTTEPKSVFLVPPSERKQVESIKDLDMYVASDNPEWIDKTTVQFDTRIQSCKEFELQPAKETWIYNIKTKEYTLIK